MLTTAKIDEKDVKHTGASIVVSFREEQGRVMHAAFYDHYVIQKITNRRTVHAIAPANTGTQIEDRTKSFEEYVKNNSCKFGDQKQTFHLPIIAKEIKNEGLLFIPGQRRFPKPGEFYDERRAYEFQLIKEARLRGQPILAICGGSWKLWNVFGGITVDVEGHTSPSMPSLGSDGSVENNPQMHAIELKDNTIVKACMDLNSKVSAKLKKQPTANSVHWAAPLINEESLKMLQICAIAKPIEQSNQVNNRFTTDSIEAFENRYGAPLVGIQWHPEAYYKTKYANESEYLEHERHLNILKYMAKSGDAYQLKQKMLQEFKDKISQGGIFKNLKHNNKLIAASKVHDQKDSKKMHK